MYGKLNITKVVYIEGFMKMRILSTHPNVVTGK